MNTAHFVDIQRELETDNRHLYAMLGDFKAPPVLGEQVLCGDELDENTVIAEVLIISEAGVVKLKVDHDTWEENL